MQFMIAVMLLASPSATARPPLPPLAATANLQERFDWATDAAAKGHCTEAIEQFQLLEQRPATQKSPILKAAINVRKGQCLMLLGRSDEGATAIQAGLPVLDTADASFAGEVFSARQNLAYFYMLRLDYASAQRELETLLKQAKGTSRATPLVDLARIRAFDGGPEPLAIAQEAIDLLSAKPDANTKPGKEQRALAHTVHARILLNQGKAAEGYAELQTAVSLLGGLTTSVTLSDIVARSDLAVAASLTGRPDKAREYLYYTGAGRMKDTPFNRALSTALPDCGSAEGLTPDDMAIVEFSLKEDGSVGATSPIYTTRGREVALAFARAVQGWSWSAEDAKAIPPFFRYATRVELRCSMSAPRAEPTEPLRRAFWQWAGVPIELQTAPSADALSAPVARKLATSSDQRTRIAALAWLGTHPIIPWDERKASLTEALRLAEALRAPTPARALLAIENAGIAQDGKPWRRSSEIAAMKLLLDDPAIAAEPTSAATVRLLLANLMQQSRSGAPEQLVDAVIADDRLRANDPLRVNALLQKASLAARRGDLTTAQASFSQTGLTEQQCALIGAPPVMKNSGASSSDFPAEALHWGFDGWVRTEYDIGADGRTANQRTVIAYPPFIFNAAATGIARDARYQTSYRPETGTGCTGYQSGTTFLQPR